ncbi:Nodal modulator 1 [Sigmodon hispidus]
MDEDGKFGCVGCCQGACTMYKRRWKVIEVGNNDVDDVNIFVFQQINQFDLSGDMIISSEFLSTLWVKLYRSENLDNPKQTVWLGQSLYIHFPPLLQDGKNYNVLLDSTLPRSQYNYFLPQVSFTALGYHKHSGFQSHKEAT